MATSRTALPAQPDASDYRAIAAALVADDALGAEWIELPIDPYSVHRPETDFLRRDDGVWLLYRGKHHAIVGASESLKSWLAAIMVAAEITQEHHAIYVDFEDTLGTFVERLRALHCRPDEIEQYAHYLAPTVAPGGGGEAYLRAMVQALEPGLIVLDGVSEAYSILGIEINSATDAAKWQRFVKGTFRFAGSTATTVEIDHPGKDEGRGAVGSQHKRAGIDGAQFTVIRRGPAFKPGGKGTSQIKVTKDRHGAVRAFAEGDRVADLILEASADGLDVTFSIAPPSAAVPEGGTADRVCSVMSVTDGLTVKEITAAANERWGSEPVTEKAVRSALNRMEGDRVQAVSMPGKASLWTLIV